MSSTPTTAAPTTSKAQTASSNTKPDSTTNPPAVVTTATPAEDGNTAQQPKPKSKRSPQQIQNPSTHHHRHSDEEEADLIVSSPTITTSEKTGMTPGDPTTTTTTTTGSNEHPTTNEHSSGPSSHRQSNSPQRSPPTTYDSSALSHTHHSAGGASFNPSLSTKCASTTSIPSAAPLHTSSSNPPSRKSTSSSRGNNDGTAPSTDEENKTVKDTASTNKAGSGGGVAVDGGCSTTTVAKPTATSATAGGMEGNGAPPTGELDVEDTASSTDIAPKRRRRRRRRIRHPHGHADQDDQGGSGATGVTGHTGDTTSMMSDAGGNLTYHHSSHPTPTATTTTHYHNSNNSRPPRGLGFEESQSGGGSDQGGGSAYVSEEDEHHRVSPAHYHNNNHNTFPSSYDHHHHHDPYYHTGSGGGEYQQHEGHTATYPQHPHHHQPPSRQWNTPRHFPDVSFPEPYYYNHNAHHNHHTYQYQQPQQGGYVRSGRGGSVSSSGGSTHGGGASSRLRMAVPGMSQTSTYPPAGSTRAGSNATTESSSGAGGGSTRGGSSPMMPPVASDGGWGPGASGTTAHTVRAHSSASSVASNSTTTTTSIPNHHQYVAPQQPMNTVSSSGGIVSSLRGTPTKLPPHPPPLPPNTKKGSLQQQASHPPTPSSAGGPTSSSMTSSSSSSRNINYYYRRLLNTPNRRGTDDPDIFAKRIDARIRAREAAERRSSSAPSPIASANVPPFDFRFRFPSSQNVLYYIYVEEPNDDDDNDAGENSSSSNTKTAPKFYPELIMVLGLDAAAQYEAEIGYNEEDEIAQLIGDDAVTELSLLPVNEEQSHQQPLITTPKVVQQQQQQRLSSSSPSTPNTVIKRRNNPYDAVNSTTLVRCSSTSSIEGDSSSTSSRRSPIAESDCNIFASAVESAATAHITSLIGGGTTSTAPTSSTTSPVATTFTQHNQQHPKTIPAAVAPSATTSATDNYKKATSTPTSNSPTSPIPNNWQQQQQRANRGTWFSDANNQERLQYTSSGSLSAATSLDGTKRRLPPQLAEKLKQASSATSNEPAPTTTTSTNTTSATQPQSKPTHQEGGSTTPTPSTKDSNPSITNDDDSTATTQQQQQLPGKTSATDVTSGIDEIAASQSHIHTVVMRSGSRSSRNSSRSRGGSQRSRESSSDSGPRGGRGRRGGSIPPPSAPTVAVRSPETTTVIHHSHQPIPPPGGLVPPEFSRVAPSSPYLYHQQRLYSGVGGAPLLPPGHSTIHAVQQRIFEQQQHYDQQHQRSQSGNVSPQLVPLSRRPVGPRGLIPIGEDADADSSTPTPEQRPTPTTTVNSTTMTVMHLSDVVDSLQGARLAAAEMIQLNSLKPVDSTKKKNSHNNSIAESIATAHPKSNPPTTHASLAEVARMAASKHQASRITPSTTSTVETTTPITTSPLTTSTRRNKMKPTIAEAVTKTTPAESSNPMNSKSIVGEPSVESLPVPLSKTITAPSTPITTKPKKNSKASPAAATTTTAHPSSPQTTVKITSPSKTTPKVEKQQQKHDAVHPTTPPSSPPASSFSGGYMDLDMKIVAKFLEEQEDIMKAKKERQKEQQRIKEEELQQQLRQRQQQAACKSKTKPSTSSTPSTPTIVKNNKNSSKPATPEVAIPNGSRNTPTTTTSQKKSKSGGNDDDLLDALIAQNDQERRRIKQQQQQSPKASVQNHEDNRSQAESITRRNQAILLAAAEAAAKRQRRCNSGGSHRRGLIHSDGDDIEDLEQDGATLELGDECSGTSTAEEDHLGLVSSAGVIGSGTPSHSTDEHVVDDERIYYTDDVALFDNLDRIGDFSPAQVEAFISATTASSQWKDGTTISIKEGGATSTAKEGDSSEEYNWCIPVEAIGGVDVAHFPPIDVRTLNEASITVLEALVVANRLRLPVHKSLQVAERHLSHPAGNEGGSDMEVSPFSHLTAIAPNLLPQHRIGVLQEVERVVQQSLSSQASPNNRILCLQPLIANTATTESPSTEVPLLAHVSYEQCLRLLSWQQATGIATTIDAAQKISDQVTASLFDSSNSSTADNNFIAYFNEALVFGKSKQHTSFAGSCTSASLSSSSTSTTPFCTVSALSIAAASRNSINANATHNPSYFPPAIGHPTLLTNNNNHGGLNSNASTSSSHAAFNSARITTSGTTNTNGTSSYSTPSPSKPSPSSHPTTNATTSNVVGSGSAVSKSRSGGGGNETVLVSHPASNTNLLRVVEEHAGCRQILENLCSQPYPAAAMERSRHLNVENLSHTDACDDHKIGVNNSESENEPGIADLQAEFEEGIVEDAIRVYHREIRKDAVLARGKALLARRKCILRHRSVSTATTCNIVKASLGLSSPQSATTTTATAPGATQQQKHVPGSSCSAKHLPSALPAPYAAMRRTVFTPQQPQSGTKAPNLSGPNYMDNIIHINDHDAIEWVSSLFVVPPSQAVATAAESAPLPYHPNCTLSHLHGELLACRPLSYATTTTSLHKNQATSSNQPPLPLASPIITTNNTRTTCCPLIGAWLMSELAIHFIDAFDRAMMYSRKAVALAAIEASHPQMGLKQLYCTIRNHQQQQENGSDKANAIAIRSAAFSSIAYMPMVSLSAPYFTMVSTLLQGHFHEQHMEPVLTKGMCQRTIGTALELGEGLALGHGCYLMALSMELLGSNPDSFALLQFSKGIALGGLPLVPSWKAPSTPSPDNTIANIKKRSQRRKNGLSSGSGTDVKLLMFSLARLGASLTSIGNYDAGEELGRAALGLLRGALGIQVEGSRPEGPTGLFSFGTLGVRLPSRDTYLTTTGHPHTGPAPCSRALLQQLVDNHNDEHNSESGREVVVSPAFGYSPATSAHYFYNVPLSVHTLLQASTSVIPSNVASVLQILQQTPNLDLHLSLLHEELHTVMALGDMTSSTTPLMSLAQVKLHLGCYLASYQDHAAEGRILDLINTGQINTPADSGRGGVTANNAANNTNSCNTVAGVLNAHSAVATCSKLSKRSNDDPNPLSVMASFPMTHTPNCRREADSIFNGAVCLRTIAEYGCLQREWEHPLVMWSGDAAVGGRRFALRYAEELAKTHNLPPAPYHINSNNSKAATLAEVAGWYRRVMRTAARLDSFENASCTRQHYLTPSRPSNSTSTTTSGQQLQDYSLSAEGVELALLRSIEMLRKCKAFAIHSTSAADVEGGSARDCFMWTPRVLSELGDTDGRAAWVLWQRQVQRQVSVHAQHRADPSPSSAKIIAQSQIISDIASQFSILCGNKEEVSSTLSTEDIEIRLVQPTHLFDAPTVKVNLTTNPDVYHLITPTPTWSVQSRISASIYQQYEALIEHEKTSDQSLNTIVGNCETEWRLLDAMERLMVQSGDTLGALMACDRRHCPNTAEITPMLRRRCGLPVQSPHTVLARLNSQGVGLAVLKPQFPNKVYPLPHLKRPNWAPTYSTTQSPAHPHMKTTSTQSQPSPAHLAVHRTVRRRERLCGLEKENGSSPSPTTTSALDHIAVAEQEAQMEVDTFKISITSVVEALPNNGNGALIGGGGASNSNMNNASSSHNNNNGGGAKKLPGGKKIVGAKGGVVTATSQLQQSISGTAGPSNHHTTPNSTKTHPFASYEDLLADTAHALMLSKSFDPAQLRDFVEGGSPSRIRYAILDALAKFHKKNHDNTTTSSPQLIEWLVSNEAALNSFLSASSEWPYDAMVVYSMFWSADDVVGAFVITREKIFVASSDDNTCFAYRMNIEHKWLPLDTKFWSVLLNPQSAYVQLQVSGGNRFDTPLTPQRAVFAGMRAPLFDSDDECEQDESNALPYNPHSTASTASSSDLPRYLGCLKTQMALLYDTLVAPLTPYLNAANVSLHNNAESAEEDIEKKAPTVCFVADGYIGHIPYSVLYNKATQRYMFQDCVVTVSPSILHLLSMVCQQRSAAVMNIISGNNSSSTISSSSPPSVPHTHISSYVGDETECGLSEATSFNTYRLIQQQQQDPTQTQEAAVVFTNQLIVPLHIEEDQLPLQADILPSIYTKRGPQKLLAHIERSTPLATLQQQLVLEADAMDAEVQMIEVLATAPTIDTSRRGEAVERLMVCSRRATALRNALSSINAATPTEDAIQIASTLVKVTDIALSARPPSSCYTGFDRFCKDVSQPHQLLPHKDLLDYTATLCTQLQLKQKDTVVSNLLFQIVHAETHEVVAEPHYTESPTRSGGGTRGALILNIPCAIDQREEFCSNLCLEPYRFVAPSSSIAAVWEIAAYPLVVLPSIGRFAVRAIHETSIPCFRSLLVAGAPRLMMPLWAIPESEHYENQHSRLHDFKNHQLAETLAFITKNRVPFNSTNNTHPPCNNSVLLASRSLDCAHSSGRGKEAGTKSENPDISGIVGSLSALVTYTQHNHMNTGVAHALHQQMSRTLHTLRSSSKIPSIKDSFSEEIIACGYWTFEGLP